jgi:hypothetical protein
MGAPNSYTDRFTVDAISMLGKVYQLKIKLYNYSGSVTAIKGTGGPFVRNLKGENDVLEDRILRSGFKFELTCETEAQFRSLFTSDWRLYIAELWKGGSLYWCGYLSPDYYSEPWTVTPYTITVEAHDGLGQLKQLDFENSLGNIFTDKISLFDIVANCLYKIMPFTNIYEGINIFEEHQDTDLSMLTETYVLAERFYQDGMMNCYDALTEALKVCNGQIFQQDGDWWIVSIGNRKDTFTLKTFTITAHNTAGLITFTSAINTTATYDPQQAITDEKEPNATKNVWWDAPSMTILPAWKQFTLRQNLGYKDNLFDPRAYTPLFTPDVVPYEPGDVIPFTAWNSTRRGGYTCPEYTLKYKNTNFEALQFQFGYFVTEVNQKFKLTFDFNGKVHLSRDIAESQVTFRFYVLVGATKHWLSTSGTWVANSAQDLFFVLVHLHKLLKLSFTVEADALPGDGFIFMEIAPIHSGDINNTVILIQKSCLTIELLGIDVIDSIDVITHNNNDQNYIPEATEMMFADFPDVENAIRVYAGGIWYKVDSNSWGITENWFTSQSPALKPLLNLLADEIGVLHVKPTWMLSGQLIGNLKPGTTVIDYHADRKFIMIRGDEDCYNDEWDVDLIEISGEPQAYLTRKQGGYIRLKSGGKIKIR